MLDYMKGAESVHVQDPTSGHLIRSLIFKNSAKSPVRVQSENTSSYIAEHPGRRRRLKASYLPWQIALSFDVELVIRWEEQFMIVRSK